MARAASCAGCALAFVACGEDSFEDWPRGRPRIDALSFDQQRAGDPFALDFGVRFTDTEGDLGEGQLRLRLNEQETSIIALAEIFDAQTPPLRLDAVLGRLTVVVRLVEEDVRAGEEIRFSFVLEDAGGRMSNEPWIVLRVLSRGGS